MAKIEPLGTRVLILPLAQESASSSSMLPEAVSERPQMGKIAAVGDRDEMATNLSKGDKVLFPKYAGTKFQINGVEYVIMEEGEVLARLN